MPLDINLIREDRGKAVVTVGGNPEVVKESLRKRFKDETAVDRVLELDAEWRKGKLAAPDRSQAQPGHAAQGEG